MSEKSKFHVGQWLCFMIRGTCRWSKVIAVLEDGQYKMSIPGLTMSAWPHHIHENDLSDTKEGGARLIEDYLRERQSELQRQLDKIDDRLTKGVRGPNYPSKHPLAKQAGE